MRVYGPAAALDFPHFPAVVRQVSAHGSLLATAQWSRRERLLVEPPCEVTHHAFDTTVTTSISDCPQRNGLALG